MNEKRLCELVRQMYYALNYVENGVKTGDLSFAQKQSCFNPYEIEPIRKWIYEINEEFSDEIMEAFLICDAARDEGFIS